MRPGPGQQALAGLLVLSIVIAALVGGIVLSSTDSLADGDQEITSVGEVETLPPSAVPVTVVPTLASSTLTPDATVILFPTSVPPAASATPTPTTSPPTASPLPTEPLIVCHVPTGWVPYLVRPGENLYRIGLRYGLSVSSLMRTNCLVSSHVAAGDVIYLPPTAPSTSVPTPVQVSAPPGLQLTSTLNANEGNCTDPRSLIISPPNGTQPPGVISFRGTASIADFLFYKMEIKSASGGEPGDYVTFLTVRQPVVNAALGEMDTAAWPDGRYWVRLTVVDSTGNYPERCARLFIFDN